MSGVGREAERLSWVIDAIAVHAERYETYAEDLARARAEPPSGSGLDDLEAELTYLRIRAARPTEVVEVGCGRATAWLLRAVRDNGLGRVHTFGRVQAVPGDLFDRLPSRIGYLFLDRAGSARSARWYLANLVSPLAPGTPVSVSGAGARRLPTGESAVVLGWLRRNRIEAFTASRARGLVARRQLERVRRTLGLEPHGDGPDPMVFFRTG